MDPIFRAFMIPVQWAGLFSEVYELDYTHFEILIADFLTDLCHRIALTSNSDFGRRRISAVFAKVYVCNHWALWCAILMEKFPEKSVIQVLTSSMPIKYFSVFDWTKYNHMSCKPTPWKKNWGEGSPLPSLWYSFRRSHPFLRLCRRDCTKCFNALPSQLQNIWAWKRSRDHSSWPLFWIIQSHGDRMS